ncbi:MoaD/ThiS family protein [bacterium]|nr:MoaD/ThiS family protein [bacterium]
MKVRIPSVLYSYTKGISEVEGRGETVDDVLRDLDRRYPGLRFRIIDETDNIRRHIMIFIDARRVASLAERVEPPAEVVIVPSISGGK